MSAVREISARRGGSAQGSGADPALRQVADSAVPQVADPGTSPQAADPATPPQAADPAASPQAADPATPPQVADPALPRITDPLSVAPKDARRLSRLFLDRLRELEEGTPEYQYARNTLVEMNLSLVKFVALRFRNRGSGEMEDVIQVGTIGLIKAIDRFDLTREVEFTSYAVPYITGEVKRFFRDTTWAVHVPRRLQELRVELAKAKEHLSTVLNRAPTVAELAQLLERDESEIIDGLVAANGYTAGTLDLPAESSEGQGSKSALSYADLFGARDPGMELFENLHALGPLLARLSDRDRHILSLRFGEELTQTKIAELLGISQMQVSRLLSRILAQLRTAMLTSD